MDKKENTSNFLEDEVMAVIEGNWPGNVIIQQSGLTNKAEYAAWECVTVAHC